MKIIENEKVYDTANPNWTVVAEYKKATEVERIYRTKNNEYIYYNKISLDNDVPTPPIESMKVLSKVAAFEKLNNFRGTVFYEKFEEA